MLNNVFQGTDYTRVKEMKNLCLLKTHFVALKKKQQNGNEEAKVMFLQILKLPILFLKVVDNWKCENLCETEQLQHGDYLGEYWSKWV
ncbi:hypothetical protein EUGRSUZ_H04619 [Eucalyptus grandis]|uniref:Uncharacterized protein n=2 Tax=Eucalyptus grandis TaxID=71139 RepID=A0ACC3JYY5_EUCGR|nr:hypothetical protein EUGRSUZ_H04619 [Eucalyptus grandis]